MLRPVLVCLAGLATASCGMVDSDPHRFENLARTIADIPLDGSADAPAGPSPAPIRTAREQGLRPAMAASTDRRLKVEVMDPHQLWDARDAGLRGAIQTAAVSAAEAAVPAVADAVVQRVSTRIAAPAAPQPAALRPAIARPAPAPTTRATIQLGAYSTPEAARAAWTKVSSGADAFRGLSPVFEAAQVNGRTLTRLKVAAPAAAAAAICRAAQVTDPWCARRA